ncbi:TPA: DUF1642 domain-containing protein [Streptococcus agalactiae]
MNIEEAKLGQTVYVKGIITDIDKDEIFDLEIHTPENDFFVNSEDVFLNLDQPKPVVKQFMADWYEENKYDFYLNLHKLAWELIENLDEDCFVLEKAIDSDFKCWYYRNKTAIKTLINMHQLGYTVEKEKLYTVEIPNPNRNSKGCAKFRLEKLGDKVYLVKRKSKDVYQNKDSQKLTEVEIRKDFDWAWQQGFMKEVTDVDI